MTIAELVSFLEPFDDEIRVVVRGASEKLIAPISYELKYLPFTNERPAIVAIQMKSAAFVDTGQGA